MLIYIIRNSKNRKVYIGQTKKTLENRLEHHFSNINSGKTVFVKAMREIGKNNFSIHLLEDVNDKVADERELYWINFYKNKTGVYNTKFSLGKEGGDTLTGHPRYKEIAKTISDKLKGANNPNASSVCSIDIYTGEFLIFNTIKECQLYHNIPRHDIISRRCRNKIKIPYKNLNFKYYDLSVSTNGR